MSVQAAVDLSPAAVARLKAAEAARVHAARVRRGRLVHAQNVARDQRGARQVVATVPDRARGDVTWMDRVIALGVRRAEIRAGARPPVEVIAAEILDLLPDDPDAAQHCADLIEAVDGGRDPRGDLTPWRTPAEDRWTDMEMREAHNLRRRRGGRLMADLPPEVAEASRAFDRIIRRRVRGQRQDGQS